MVFLRMASDFIFVVFSFRVDESFCFEEILRWTGSL